MARLKRRLSFGRHVSPGRFCAVFILSLLVAACAERGTLDFAAPDGSATRHTIWVANYRTDQPANSKTAPPRPENVRFEAIDISIPPTHEVGQIEWPDGTPDASKHFVSLGERQYPSRDGFTRSIAQADGSGRNETLLFVHGYNTRHSEAVYQLAQLVHDFEVPTPPVLFSWPSAGVTAGYVYDRDSALLARDKLEATLISLTKDGRKVVLIGHSMGSYLIMETLRQIALKRSMNIDKSIDALILMAPDIDGELFRNQANAIGRLPDPFILMVAKQDRALRISSLLTGRRPRLGAQTDRSVVGDLPISVVDVSDLAVGGNFDHKIVTTSPAAIAIIKQLSQEAPPGDAHIASLVVLSQIAP